MKRFCFAFVATAVGLVAGVLRADDRPSDTSEPALKPAQAESSTAAEDLPAPAAKEPAAEDQPAASDQTDALTTSPEGDRWRFKFHNDHWWYWLPSNRWVYRTGSRWEDYEPQAYAQWYLRQRQERYAEEVARYDAMRAGGAPFPSPFFPPFGVPFPYPSYPVNVDVWIPGVFGFQYYGSPGNFNYATSVGGYMGDALRGPAGY